MSIYQLKTLIILALLALMPIAAFASSVHKWVDENGVTHYSDQAPEHQDVQVDQFEISNAYEQSSVEDDYYSVSNQWARMHAERIARKQLQLEKARLKQTQSEATPQIIYLNQEHENRRQVYYPVYANRFAAYRNKHIHNSFRRGLNYNYVGRNCNLPRNNYSRSRLSLSFR